MTTTEENPIDPEAPYGWTIDKITGDLRAKKSPGRPRVHQVADEADPSSHLETRRKSVRANLDNYYARNPGIRKEYGDAWRQANQGKYSEYNKKSNLKLKRQIMNAYGGRCACCGETELVFLTMAADKGSPWGQAGSATYRWLRDNEFPEGFQVLCANCNCGKQWNGGVCPHTQMADEFFSN